MTETTSGIGGLAADTQQPGGGRIGVSFDWGFAVTLAIGALSSLAGRPIGPPLPVPVAAGALVVVAIMVVLGEALRRGNGLARRVQIAFHALLMLIGPAILLPIVEALQQGRLELLWSLALSALLVYVVSPLEIWLLMKPASRQWYGVVEQQAARVHHGGGWLTGTIVWAVVCGVLQAFAPF